MKNHTEGKATRRAAEVHAVEMDPESRAFVRGTCEDLDGRYDRAALDLLLAFGGLSIEDPSKLGDAIDRLAGVGGKDPDEAFLERMEAGYLLGVAVGRRLGNRPLADGRGGAR